MNAVTEFIANPFRIINLNDGAFDKEFETVQSLKLFEDQEPGRIKLSFRVQRIDSTLRHYPDHSNLQPSLSPSLPKRKFIYSVMSFDLSCNEHEYV